MANSLFWLEIPFYMCSCYDLLFCLLLPWRWVQTETLFSPLTVFLIREDDKEKQLKGLLQVLTNVSVEPENSNPNKNQATSTSLMGIFFSHIKLYLGKIGIKVFNGAFHLHSFACDKTADVPSRVFCCQLCMCVCVFAQSCDHSLGSCHSFRCRVTKFNCSAQLVC